MITRNSIGAVIFLALAQIASAQGILLYKQYAWDNANSPSIIKYKKIKKFESIYHLVNIKGNPQEVTKPLVIVDIPTPHLSYAYPDFIEDHQYQKLKHDYAIYNSYVKKWPSAKKPLSEYLASLSDHLSKYENGFVKVSNVWISKADYKRKEAQAKAEALAAEIERKKQRQAQLNTALETLTTEKRKLEANYNECVNEISALKDTLLKENSDRWPIQNLSKHAFLLQRKVTEIGFPEAYKLAPYVFQCLTDGNEIALLATRTISDLSQPRIIMWVAPMGDQDVEMTSGSTERVPLFVEPPSYMLEKVGKLEEILEKKSVIEDKLNNTSEEIGKLVEQGAEANP